MVGYGAKRSVDERGNTVTHGIVEEPVPIESGPERHPDAGGIAPSTDAFKEQPALRRRHVKTFQDGGIRAAGLPSGAIGSGVRPRDLRR
jgi:hypothetical protein